MEAEIFIRISDIHSINMADGRSTNTSLQAVVVSRAIFLGGAIGVVLPQGLHKT
jgi:hypothetical protein